MNLSLPLALVVSAAAITSFSPPARAQASSFGEQEVERERFVAVAAPYRHGYNLMIIEQIPGQRKCWNELGAYPTVVEPLLLNFDFTNACRRSSSSNNYSIRLGDQDLGMDYLPEIVKKNGELQLIATPRAPHLPELQIGRTYGFSSGALKIHFNPGWRITKRTYEGETTQHIYLSSNSSGEPLLSQTAPSAADGEQQVPNIYLDVAPATNSDVSYQQPNRPPAPTGSAGYPYQQPPNVYLVPAGSAGYPYQQPPNIYLVPAGSAGYPYQQPPNLYPAPAANPDSTYQQPPNVYFVLPANPGYPQQPSPAIAPPVNSYE
ncbi:MAG: DUF3747 domain-containing protein [Cyanophyceae cyanobacterium]